MKPPLSNESDSRAMLFLPDGEDYSEDLAKGVAIRRLVGGRIMRFARARFDDGQGYYVSDSDLPVEGFMRFQTEQEAADYGRSIKWFHNVVFKLGGLWGLNRGDGFFLVSLDK